MTDTLRGSVKRCGVPLLVHVPHASRVIPSDVRTDILLTNTQLEDELERITDHEVDVLFDPVVGLGGVMVVNGHSRLVVDPERFRSDEEETAAAFGAGAVYSKACDGTQLRDPARYPTVRIELGGTLTFLEKRVSRQRVNQLLSTDEDFPVPEAELIAGRVWKRADVEAWIKRRRRR